MKRRANDVTLLMLDPYFLTRELALLIWELGRELWEAWRQHRNNVQPRLNRMKDWYPFVRAGTCSIMRDISAQIAIMDMMRGAPSIYMLYLGYDEVAHHSGPWTSDAFGELKRLDKTFARLRHVIKEKVPRPYDLIILSDHGQSFGATFKQRYGLEIKDYIEQLLPEGTSVSQSIGGDTGAMGLNGLAGELDNVSQTGSGNAFDRTVAQQGSKLASKAAKTSDKAAEGDPASVTAYGSGNAAQVYFDLSAKKIKLSELETAYPGMVDKLVEHEGIGLVLGYEDDGTVLVIGKGGTRNLHTGEVKGEDPLIPYAPATRARRSIHREARLADETGDGIPQRRRSVGHQYGLRGWHGRSAGRTDRQSRRRGRRADRCLSFSIRPTWKCPRRVTPSMSSRF